MMGQQPPEDQPVDRQQCQRHRYEPGSIDAIVGKERHRQRQQEQFRHGKGQIFHRHPGRLPQPDQRAILQGKERIDHDANDKARA